MRLSAKWIFSAVLFINFSLTLQAGNDNYPVGARASSLAGTSVILQDAFSLQNNQAGLANLQKITFGVYYEDKYLLPELSLRGFYSTFPIKKYGVLGVSATQFGQRLYSESKIGLAYSLAITDRLYAGLQLDYLHTYFPGSDYGTKAAVAAELGAIMYVNKNLLLGFHIYNPTKTKLSNYNNEYSPTIYKLGGGYYLSEKVLLCAETEKHSQIEDLIFKIAMEYKPMNLLVFRAGINSQDQFSFGVGILSKGFHIDIASTYRQMLGFTPSVSLQYEF